jgi:hypothetical protein
MARDLYQRLEAWDDWPEAWRPVPGEILVGTVESFDTWVGKYGETPVVFVWHEVEQRLVAVYLSAMVLRQEFEKLHPQPGARIGIKYLGRAAGKSYHKYRVILDPSVRTPVPVAMPAEVDDDDVPC